MSTVPRYHVTPEEYLEIDSNAEIKSEYFRGEMFALAGGTFAHNVLGSNLHAELRPFLREKKCAACTSDMRVKAGDSGLYTYPDVTVVCGAPRIDSHNTLENPTAIFEVLSPSTALYDRGRKFEMYRHIQSLQLYVLIEQDRAHVEVFTKIAGVWTLSEASGLQATVDIPVLEAHIPLASLYENVDLEMPQQALE